jgi:hypothetical protein
VYDFNWGFIRPPGSGGAITKKHCHPELVSGSIYEHGFNKQQIVGADTHPRRCVVF